MLSLTAWLGKRTAGTAWEQAGNYLFWTSFCVLGQPGAVLLYYDLLNPAGDGGAAGSAGAAAGGGMPSPSGGRW